MKEVSIISKIVGRAVDSMRMPSAAPAASVDLSGYLPKSVWDGVWEIRETDEGTRYVLGKLPVVLQYGLTMYADGSLLDIPSIYDGLPLDNDTIYWEEIKDEEGNVIGKRIKARGGSGEGGITPTLLGDLTNVGTWANAVATEDRIMVQRKDSSSWTAMKLSEIGGGSADFSNVLSSGDGNAFTSFILSEDKKTLTFVKGLTFAEKSDSLSGYGITDAYTKTEVDNLVGKYLSLQGGTIQGDVRLRKGSEYTSPYLYFGDSDEVFLVEETDQSLTIHANKNILLDVGGNVTLNGDEVSTKKWVETQLGDYAEKSSTLAGYGITDAKISNGVITLGGNTITPLTSHQTIYNLTLQAGTFSAATFDPNGGAKTVNIPTTTSHISEGSNLYFTNARAVSALSDTLKAYVTLSGTQTITGEKDFTGGLKVNGSPIVYDKTNKYWKLEGDLLVTGGITMYGVDGSSFGTIWDNAPIASVSSKGVASFDPNYFSVNNGHVTFIGSTGGLDEYALANYLSSNKYLTQTDGDARYLLASDMTSLNVNVPITYLSNFKLGSLGTSSNIAIHHSNQFGVYGMVDYSSGAFALQAAYQVTPTALDILLQPRGGNVAIGKTSATCALDVNGAIKGTSGSFSGSVSMGSAIINGGNLYYDSSEKYWKFDGNLLVTGGITMYGVDGSSFGTIWDNAPIASVSSKGVASFDPNYFSVNNGHVTFIGDVGGLDESALASYLSNNKYLTQTTGDARYLAIGGNAVSASGLSGLTPIISASHESNEISAVRNNYGAITANAPTSGAAITNALKFRWYDTDWQIGNVRNMSTGTSGFGVTYGSSNLRFLVKTDGVETYGTLKTNGVIPASNGSYSLGSSSYKWTSVYASSFEGNATSATTASKLSTTSKTAWGQTYWTSGGVPTSISGDMTGVGSITMSGVLQMANGKAVKLANNSGVYKGIISMSASNEFCLGYDSSASSYDTYIYGFNMHFRTSSSHSEIFTLGSDGSAKLHLKTSSLIIKRNHSNGGVFTKYQPCNQENQSWAAGVNNTYQYSWLYQNVSSGIDEEKMCLDSVGSLHVKGSYYIDSNTGTGAGYALYSTQNPDMYGILMGTRSSFGTHGGMTGGWATYFCMNGNGEARGWVFRNSYNRTNVASITTSGDMLVNGGITMYSDIRKKTILNHVELSLKEVADAPLIEHYYNSDEKKTTHVGSVAQYWAGLNDWFCKEDSEGFLTMEIQNAALASAISVARELTRYESKTDKQIKKLKKRIGELEEEIENLKNK